MLATCFPPDTSFSSSSESSVLVILASLLAASSRASGASFVFFDPVMNTSFAITADDPRPSVLFWRYIVFVQNGWSSGSIEVNGDAGGTAAHSNDDTSLVS
jgi:hypothetical protein